MSDATMQTPLQHAVQGKNEQTKPAGKKKPSWFHTIMWMVSMMLLVNVVMAIIAYTLHQYGVF